MRKQPYLEVMLNKLDAVALTCHVFVMFVGSMYLTEKLPNLLSTIVALLVVISSGVALLWISQQVKREVSQTVPWIGALMRPKYWQYYSFPTLLAHTNYYFLGKKKREYMLNRKRLHDYILQYRPHYRFEYLNTIYFFRCINSYFIFFFFFLPFFYYLFSHILFCFCK